MPLFASDSLINLILHLKNFIKINPNILYNEEDDESYTN
jgi:hypothetical protein